MGAGQNAAVITQRGEFFEDDLMHERAFAGTGSSCDTDEQAERDFHVEILQIILAGTPNSQLVFAGRAAFFRRGNFFFATEKRASE